MYTPSSPEFQSSGPPPTPGCPSCQSGMVAPGCRHSARCVRAHQAWYESRRVSFADNDEYSPSIAPDDLNEDADDGMPSVPSDSHGLHADAGDVVVETETRDDLEEFAEIDRLDAKSLKREADVSVERLEESMRADGHSKKSAVSGIVSGMIMIEDSLAWESIALMPWLATDDTPCLELPLFSIRFSPNATSVVISFGKEKLRLWVPESAIDDASLKELPGEATLKGMQLEMSNLSEMGCGDVYSASDFEQSGLSKTCGIIPSRWATADKGSGVVRARIVLKDVAKGSDSARALGISSPTPSSDSLSLLLGIAGNRGWPIATGDVSSAFMCTPLRKRNIVAKLPMSVSSMGGEPVFLHLARALNGLRSASQEWVVFLSPIVNVLGLSTCSLEPCLFSGILPMGQPCLILVYVDDLIVTAPTCEALDFVFEKVGREVKLKRTGTVGSSGQVRFLGRNISRQKGESSVLVSLPEDYLNETFEDYKIKSSSKCPPDLTQYLDKENGSELSPEAYSRLRSALGKVSWLAQTRQDLRAFVGYLATQQSKPTGNTEDAMRALLRYLKSDMCIALRLPCNSEILEAKGVQGPHLVAFSDASHAPLKTTGRRGVTGGVVIPSKEQHSKP